MWDDNQIMEIANIRFSLLSEQEIRKMAVCEVSNTKMSGPGSVYDERMGVLQNGKACLSCGNSNKDCVGHFGFMTLARPIIHPLFFKHVMSILRCVCAECNRLILTPGMMRFHGIHRVSKQLRLKKLRDKLEKISECAHCGSMVHKYVISTADKMIYRVIRGGEGDRVLVSDDQTHAILSRLTPEDLFYLGYSGTREGIEGHHHPQNMVLTVLPVLPPVARPYIISDNVTCDDDLTIQYLEIIKANNHIRNPAYNDIKKAKYISLLKFRIRSLFDNSSGSSKHSNGRPLRGIKKRLTGKEGLIRNNLMGKRVDKSARSVIGPDPTLRTDEIAVPREIANILTRTVPVTEVNRDEIMRWLETDLVNYIIRRDGNTRINVKYACYKHQVRLMNGDWIRRKGERRLRFVMKDANSVVLMEGDSIFRDGEWIHCVPETIRRPISVEVGDVVERRLVDGDILLLNRQPTLHKGSMIAQKIRVMDCKTIRLNLATTKTFNADFDGDEMNLHCPASIDAETELRLLSSLPNHLISCQSSQPIITIVQDSLTGAYLMTRDDAWMTRDEFLRCMTVIRQSGDLMGVLEERTRPCHIRDDGRMHGRLLVSLLMPRGFYYASGGVEVRDGVFLSGVLTKKHLGGSSSSILKCLITDYDDSDICVRFLDNIQFLTREFIMIRGFSIGLQDCMISDKKDQIDDAIDRSFVKASSIEESIRDPMIRETFVGVALSSARDTGMMIAHRAMDPSNNFITTVASGSKGDYFNIAQITGVVGQQYLGGNRIMASLSQQERTLPHYPFDADDMSLNDHYESNGFVRHSFVHGLNMREFFFHSMTGREGVTDTAMKTATSGYIQRRMIKIAEDIKVNYDGTVRNSSGNIIQFHYGGTGLDPSKTMGADSACPFINVKRLVHKLNN